MTAPAYVSLNLQRPLAVQGMPLASALMRGDEIKNLNYMPITFHTKIRQHAQSLAHTKNTISDGRNGMEATDHVRSVHSQHASDCLSTINAEW